MSVPRERLPSAASWLGHVGGSVREAERVDNEAHRPAPCACDGRKGKRWASPPFSLFLGSKVIGSTKIAPRVRELTDGRYQVEFHALCRSIFGVPVNELLPVQRAIVEGELAERNFRQRSRSTLWETR
jgi:hypothetical protein